MAIEIGPILRRRREWARLTQQELVDHTRMDRSASYISALETGRISPTLVELEQLARYFRLSVIELLQGATVIATWNHLAVSDVVAEAEQVLSAAQADSLVPSGGAYTDLRIRVTAGVG